jgi:hypothetical protein
MAIDLDKITMDDIFKGFDKQAKEFDAAGIDKFYRDKYPDKLEKYILLSYEDLGASLEKGSVIKFTKKNSDDISCSCFIKSIAYLETDSKIIEYLVVSKGPNTVWRIYPSNHYIFKLDRLYKEHEKTKMIRNEFTKAGKSIKDITVDDKTYRLYLASRNTPTDEIEKQIKLNKKTNDLFKKHAIQKEINSKKKYMDMVGKNIKIGQVDEIYNDILKNHKHNPKKKTDRNK